MLEWTDTPEWEFLIIEYIEYEGDHRPCLINSEPVGDLEWKCAPGFFQHACQLNGHGWRLAHLMWGGLEPRWSAVFRRRRQQLVEL